MFKLNLKKVGTTDQIANICWITEKAREFQKKIYTSALLTMPKPLTVWITANCGKFFKRWEYHHFTCLLYEGQEATVKTRDGIMDWLKIVYCLYTVTLMSPLTCVHSTS